MHFKSHNPVCWSGGKDRQYCFSDVPGNPISCVLCSLRWNGTSSCNRAPTRNSSDSDICNLSHSKCLIFLVLPVRYFSFFCKYWEGLSKMFLADKVRDEGIFDAGLKQMITQSGYMNHLKKSLLYYPLRRYRKFRFLFSIWWFCYRIWNSEP